MSIKKLTIAAVAALGLTLGAYSASIAMGHGGHGGGGMGGGGMGGGMSHSGGMGGSMGHSFGGNMGGNMGHSYGGMGHSYGSMGHSYGSMGPMRGPGAGHSYAGVTRGRGLNGDRTALHNGHRGYWRQGQFFPFYGIGLWGGDYGNGGGSCFWNCRTAGYSPGYCSANAYAFCD